MGPRLDLGPATPFEQVFWLAELGDSVMDALALPALIALAYTSRNVYIRVQLYLRSKMRLALVPFGLNRSELMQQIELAQSFIIGAIVLKMVAPAKLSITTNNIDVIVVTSHVRPLENWIRNQGFVQKLIGNHDISGYFGPFQFCHSFGKQVQGSWVEINLLIVDSRSSAYQLVFHTSNTACMNILGPRGIWTGYRTLLTNQIAIQNHVTQLVSMNTMYRSAEQHQNYIHQQKNIKTQSRGFIFPGAELYHPSNSCPNCLFLSACPLTIRKMNDRMCSYMPISSDGDIQTDTCRIPIRRHHCPPLV